MEALYTKQLEGPAKPDNSTTFALTFRLVV